MNSPVLDLCVTQAPGLAAHPVPSRRLTAGPDAATVAELRQAAPGWADLRGQCAGLALGYGERHCDAARKSTELCLAAGADQALMQAWIKVGRQRARTAATRTRKARIPAG